MLMLDMYQLLLKIFINNHTDLVSVVIPIYNTELSLSEKLSLNRCLTVLGNYPITIICPDKIPTDKIELLNGTNVKFEFFDSVWFTSKESYSKLMLSIEFYERFLPYKYILIYQLDAFVFKDDLLDWCNKGFDYIGAPWFDEDLIDFWSKNLSFMRRILKKLNIPFKHSVGNGGFSLRNVKKCLFVLLLFRQRVSKWIYYEDLFWAYFVTSYCPFFRVADSMTAIKFSFETYPERCYALNNNNLPFGCHAWEKYNLEFWQKFFN